jgi:hypothetical protein
MPRIMRFTHEYYENRIIWGFDIKVVDDGTGKKQLSISPGGGVVNKEMVETVAEKVLPVSDFILDGNKKARTDIVVLDSTGEIYVMKGVPGSGVAPTSPEIALQLAHVSIKAGWNGFVGSGAHDEVICMRSNHVIDTRFEPLT